MTVLEDEVELAPKLELDEEALIELDEEEAPRSRYQTKKERKRLVLLDSVHAIAAEAEEFSKSKTILAVLPNIDDTKELLAMLREKKPDAKKSMLSVANVHIAYNEKQLGVKADFIIIHQHVSMELVNKIDFLFGFSNKENEEIANALIKQDANRELCRKCKDIEGPDSLPYGEETGLVEWKAQYNAKNEPTLDPDGNQLYIEFPELTCSKGHRWYKGEGARRNVKGKNPILLDSHYKMRQQREIYVDIGTPDPAYTRDRHDKPERGIFIRTHPNGRKTNTEAQRKSSGASFYR